MVRACDGHISVSTIRASDRLWPPTLSSSCRSPADTKLEHTSTTQGVFHSNNKAIQKRVAQLTMRDSAMYVPLVFLGRLQRNFPADFILQQHSFIHKLVNSFLATLCETYTHSAKITNTNLRCWHKVTRRKKLTGRDKILTGI